MITKIKDWLNAHENFFQIVKFILISLIAFVAEYVVFLALQYGLANTCGQDDFKWFLFEYKGGKEGAYGLAGFIAFLISKCIAEVISFTINRKKNFKSDNNLAFSIITYVITIIGIILLSTWLGGALSKTLGPKIGADWANIIGKFLGSFISFVIIFIMDKFVIMTKKGIDKKNAEQTTESTSEEVAESVPEETPAEEIAQTEETAEDAAEPLEEVASDNE